VNRTLELIDGQAHAVLENGARIKYVFVVGGFGTSRYLYHKVSEYCTERGFEARQPDFPWSSIVRGAVARGLEAGSAGLVSLRLCRRHYGTPVAEVFSPLRGHIEEDSFIEEYTGEKMARGQMHWLLSKGQGLTNGSPKRASIDCIRTFSATESRMWQARLVACDEDDAPKRYMHNSAYNVCTVHADLTSVPLEKFMECRRGPNQVSFYMAEFKIGFVIDGATLKFFLNFDGQEYGSVSAKYDP